MTTDDKIRDEKLKYDINREAAKISTLSSTLPSDQSTITEQAKFTYSSLIKAFEKQIKTIEDQGMKQAETVKALKQEENQEIESIQGLFPKKDDN